MSTNKSLFPQRDWLNPVAPREPMLWLRQIRLLYRLEAATSAEIRRINLQRGLNIVWAKPADPDEANPRSRGRGHDVGKTSFCRLIRFLLGEEHYGNEDFRFAIARNEKFSRAWVVGEIVLDGEAAGAKATQSGASSCFSLLLLSGLGRRTMASTMGDQAFTDF